MPPDAPFAETLAAATRGEEWAVAVLWRNLNPRLLRYLRVRHGASYEDVASETWLRVTQGLHRFEGSEVEFRAWFFTIARATSVDWYRRTAARPRTVNDDAHLDRYVADEDPAQSTLDAMDTDRALELIARLAPDQADVVLLRVVAGLDMDRVSRILGKRPGAVRVLQHRALRRLAELVDTPTSERRGVTK